MSPTSRFGTRRTTPRKAGLRPVEIWVPDTRQPGFAAECRRQSRLAARADRRDAELLRLLDAALVDVSSGRRP
jgi:hypothetical protein